MSQSGTTHNYEYLNAMSTEQLRELLLLEIESDQDHDELVLHILEVIKGRKKEEDPQQLTWQQARADFDKYYNTPDGKGQQLYPMVTGQREVPARKKKPGKIIRLVATAAAILAVVFLTVPPALGYSDVWDMVARWTDNVLQMKHVASVAELDEPIQAERTLEFSSIQEAFETYQITAKLAPQKYPDGFTFDNIVVSERPLKGEIVFYATFYNHDAPLYYSVTSRKTPVSRTHERNTEYIEIYEVSGIQHTIFSNNTVVAAVWNNLNYECTLWADITATEMKAMIQSIYEGDE